VRRGFLLLLLGCQPAVQPPPSVTIATPLPGVVDAGPKPRPTPVPVATAEGPLPSFEEAIASGAVGSTGKDLSNAELGRPLAAGPWLADCGTPDSMRVTIKVAIRDGAAVGVTVKTSPADQRIERCVEQAVAQLRWPESTATDAVTVTY
jgi:hypothetical protein